MATTDEVWRLDNGDDDDCRFFQKMANSGHYGTRQPNKSRQGIYVFTANGKFLASINHRDPDRVLETLKLGWKRWKQLAETERTPKPTPQMDTPHRWEKLRPKDGLVLTGYVRDLHHQATPDSKPLRTWNSDAAWFSAEEARSMIPSDVRLGQSFDLPDVFVTRMCRIHFVDCVKGQTDAFDREEVDGSQISAKVVAITDQEIQLELSGDTSGICKAGKWTRGVQTTLIGNATFDRDKQRFTRFNFVALGKRWGRTRYNDRVAQQNESPIGFAFHLALPNEPVIVPGIVWAYRTPWLKF